MSTAIPSPLPSVAAPSGSVEIVAARGAAQARIVVVLPTFKRPDHLLRTIESVVRQSGCPPFALIVMDNEPLAHEGADVAVPALAAWDGPSIVLIAHRRGNCAAYNAGFATALAHYPEATHIQIIDDDEIARPGWLAALHARAEQTSATATGAPQVPVFDHGADTSMATHPVFRPPHQSGGIVPILYSSGNVMIRTDWLWAHGSPWLDEGFNFLGGGDSDFFSRSRTRGATFAWEPLAAVDETTPARRSELSWLNSRSLRNGSISAAIERKAARSAGDRLTRWMKTAILLGLSPWRALRLFASTGSPTMSLDPMNVALGRALMEFGFANEQYRAAESN